MLLEQWQLDVSGMHRRLIPEPTPREREQWHAIWLLAQGWTASAIAEALEREPHTIGRWACPRFHEGRLSGSDFRAVRRSPHPQRGAAGSAEGVG